VFDELRIVDAPGSPTMREACRPWLRDFAGSIFGAYDGDTGRRLITEFFLLISKKNAKSTGAAAIMLTALIRNWRKSGEFGILAPTIEIANNSFWPARDMVRADDELRELIHVQEHTRTLTHRVTGATLKVVASDNESVGGKKWIGTLIDEVWLFGKRSNAENMLREAIGGLASRPEGFVIYLSTQSDEPPAGVFKQKLHYARGVRDGRIDDRHFLPVLYEFPQSLLDAKAERDQENFYITNPNIGASVDQHFLTRELQKAEEAGEESLRGFLAKHLNVEIGLALQSDRWAGADHWQKQGRPGLTLDQVIERSDVLTVGIDGGGLDDLMGLAVVGRDATTREWLAWTHAWAHPSVLERRKAEAPRLRDFAKDGNVSLVKAIGDDVLDVAEIAAKVYGSGKMDKIGVDPAGIGAIVDAIVEAGIEQDRIVGISQGWKMVGAIKTTERKLAEGALIHGAQPLMAWCVGNARVEPKGNAIAITKQTAGAAKIDPLMALFNAVSLMALNPASCGPSFWESGQHG
jgi:phage terminase large subunit-like protein